MRSVTHSMGVSLDGYIIGPDGTFDWTLPDKEVFRFVTDDLREVGVQLLGRRLYETMLYWVGASRLAVGSQLAPLRCSIGISCSEPEDDVDSLIHRADQALNAAKELGRDRTA